ncbi:MAG: hypothetical protein Q7T87_04220 [Polaromonas sp.]|nr:hypothetical protein [Polaromonas sp.]
MPQTLSQIEALARELASGGLRAGLRWLNRRVAHRFTAAYLLEGQMLRLVAFVDKLEQPVHEGLKAVPLQDSFCVMAIRDGQFVTADGSADARLDGHPAQHWVRSYVGLPVHRGPNELIGTFCHLDYDPQTIEDREYAFLQDAVTFLSPYVERGNKRRSSGPPGAIAVGAPPSAAQTRKPG